MINAQEGIGTDENEFVISAVLEGAKKLKDDGLVLLIEPGKLQNKKFLEKLTEKAAGTLSCVLPATICTTDVQAIRLNQQAADKKCGLRGKAIKEHWFSTVILSRQGALQ